MTVNFDIIPRQALAPSDFKALGRAIRRWLRLHAKQQGSVRWYDSDSLTDLLKGQPPRPLPEEGEASVLEGAEGGLSPAGAPVAVLDRIESGRAVQDRVEPAMRRPVCLSLVYNKSSEHRQVMSNLRRALPISLVADVLVDGLSWDDPTHREIGLRRAPR